jgi:transposase-like protein
MTKYLQKTREEVFLRYGVGEPILAIAKRTGINPKTIYRWRDKYNWDSRKGDIDEEMSNHLVQSVAQTKVRQIQTISLILDNFLRKLLDGKVEIKTSDILTAMKHQLELCGETNSTNKEDFDKRIMELLEETDKQFITAMDFSRIYEEIQQEEKQNGIK